MSLRYASRVAWRAAQAVAARVRQPPAPASRTVPGAVKAKPGAVAQRAQQGGQGQAAGGGLAGVSAEKLRRRRAEKDNNVMQLVCWGPN